MCCYHFTILPVDDVLLHDVILIHFCCCVMMVREDIVSIPTTCYYIYYSPFTLHYIAFWPVRAVVYTLLFLYLPSRVIMLCSILPIIYYLFLVPVMVMTMMFIHCSLPFILCCWLWYKLFVILFVIYILLVFPFIHCIACLAGARSASWSYIFAVAYMSSICTFLLACCMWCWWVDTDDIRFLPFIFWCCS